jgi:hypothetical protein
MCKFISLILIVSTVTFSQVYNVKTTSFSFSDFKADSMKQGPLLNISDNENIEILTKVNDTSAAGFKTDSIKFVIGYQRGCITTNASGLQDTAWLRPSRLIDTIDALDTLNWQAAGSLVGDTLLAKALDTAYVTGFITNEKTFTAFWSPIARIWVKGLTGNKKTSPLKIEIDVIRRKYSNVDISTGRQP